MPTKKEKQPLSVTHPELAKEADGWDPTLVSAGSGKKYKWRCEHGHEWLATCGNRTISKSNCPVCAGQKAWPGFNDVATTHPMLAVEADGWNPTEFIAGTNRKLAWKCKLNHSWTATGYSRIAGSGCPYCTNQKLLSGFNDLRTKYPEVARQADGWDPKSVGAGSSLRLGWKCEVGHQWTATVMGRTGRDKTNCPICSNKVIHIGFNDLLTTRSDLAKEAEGWDPTKIGAGSNAIVKWKCQKGHIWKASVKNRTIKNSGCPFCSNHKIQSGFNDLRTTHPDLASQAFEWDTTRKGFGSNAKVEWQCDKKHVWTATINSRVNGVGCPYCSGKYVLIGFNDLSTTHPVLANQAHGWDPTKYSHGSDVRKKWICDSGHIWIRSISGRVYGTGCPTCATHGFDPNSEAWLYFLSHPNWLMLQIGITNFPENRLKGHKKLGWELVELRGPMDGLIAREWETSILQMLKMKGADLSNPKIAGKFDGYTEAWSIACYQSTSLRQLMKDTEEFEGDHD